MGGLIARCKSANFVESFSEHWNGELSGNVGFDWSQGRHSMRLRSHRVLVTSTVWHPLSLSLPTIPHLSHVGSWAVEQLLVITVCYPLSLPAISDLQPSTDLDVVAVDWQKLSSWVSHQLCLSSNSNWKTGLMSSDATRVCVMCNGHRQTVASGSECQVWCRHFLSTILALNVSDMYSYVNHLWF